MNARAMSILLGGSPTPNKRNIIDSAQKDSKERTRSLSIGKELREILDQIELPRETMYMIDKVVRQRAKRGPFGVDNSELINDQQDRETNEKNERIQRLVEGLSSHSRIINTGDESHKDGDMSID